MPPKKAPAKKLHELAAEVRVGHKIADISKKTFIVGKQFATGGFGRIHTCTEEGKRTEMVMKIEPSTNGPLLTEVVVFNRILKEEHLEKYKKRKKIDWIGLPHVIANGFFTYNSDKMRYLVIPKYWGSLEGVREKGGGVLKTKDAMQVARCVLDALEYLHDVDYTHADVKAANILLEKENVFSSAVLVDFGLAHKTTNNVDKPDKKRAHNGTCIFTSTDAHRGNNPSYRGDIEILAYNLVLWLTGSLPWMALESSPDKVFEAKQKFVAGLPSSFEKLLKTPSSSVVSCVTSMFNVAMKTDYTSNVDMDKLRKLVATVDSSSSRAQKTSRKAKKEEEDEEEEEEEEKVAPTPRKSARRAEKPSRRYFQDEDPFEDLGDEVDEEVVVPRTTKSRRKVVQQQPEEETKTPRKTRGRAARHSIDDEDQSDDDYRIPKTRKKAVVEKKKKKKEESSDEEEDKEEEEEEVEEEEEDVPSKPVTPSRPSMRLPLTSSTVSRNSTARKIEQKYKRLSQNKSALRPVTIVTSSDGHDSPGTSDSRPKRRSEEGGVTLKTPVLITPAIKRAKYKSGISSADKASPTELRRVPGVRNFPKGRRSLMIQETAAKYQAKRAAQKPAEKPTFDDNSNDSEV